jgi:putative N6-adenine-specific DNA methylase
MAFERWVDRDRAAWDALRADAEARWQVGRQALPVLLGNDAHEGALSIARTSAEAAEVGANLEFVHGDVSDYAPATRPAMVVSNPPWGLRLDDDPGTSWSSLGSWLKRTCPGATAWLLAGEGSATRDLHLRASRKIPVWAGPIECRWLQYPIDAEPTAGPPG